MKTECDKWLNTVTDSELDNHSQSSLANEAWKRGAAHAAQEILNHLELIDTVKIAVRGCAASATTVGRARVTADRFIGQTVTAESEELVDRVLEILGNPGITETTYAKLKVALAGKAYTAPLDDYVTLLERNNGRLREVLKEALGQTGCDGDLCNYRWHEKARVLLGE